jgi:hypothetical protein
MSIIKSFSRIRNLAYLGQEINHVFNKYGHHRALIMSRPLLLEYYRNMDYDWLAWQTGYTGEKPHCKDTDVYDTGTTINNITTSATTQRKDYIKTQIPINQMIPATGTPLGYRMRVSGDNSYPFDMFLITWQPGQKSGIHYHPVFGCAHLVLQGQLIENIYALDHEKSKMKQTGWRVHPQGTVGYIDNNIGAHRIINKFT